MITTFAPIAKPSWTALNATADGSEFSGPTTTGTELLSPQVCNCWLAAARKVSAAPNTHLFPLLVNLWTNFPTVVVLPVPLIPTIMITEGVAEMFKERSLAARDSIN